MLYLVTCQLSQNTSFTFVWWLHLTVLDFVSEEAIEDACVIGRYLSDTDLFLAPSSGALSRNFEVGNFKQSIAASVAVRGVLFGNCYPVSSRYVSEKIFCLFRWILCLQLFWQCRWHAIRRPMLWQVEQSLLRNKVNLASNRTAYFVNENPILENTSVS